MKQLITFFLCSFISTQLLAQGTILGFTVVPPFPTEQDNIEIHVDLQFNSGDCAVQSQNHSVNGTTIHADALHCTGMLTYICNRTDVFEIGELAAGDYTFDFTLSSGFGSPSCSPGIVPDGNEQFQFSVSTTVGIDELHTNSDLFYPNPASDVLFFKTPLTEAATITDVRGNVVMVIAKGEHTVQIAQLSAGVYFLKHGQKQLKLMKQ